MTVNKAKRKADSGASLVSQRASLASHRAFSAFQPNMPEPGSLKPDESTLSQNVGLQLTPTDLFAAFSLDGFALPLSSNSPELLSFGPTDSVARGISFDIITLV